MNTEQRERIFRSSASGWVFMGMIPLGDDEVEEEVGFSEPQEHRNAEDAYESFSQEYADHFGVFFRDKHGVLHPTSAESQPEDFEF